MLNIIENRFILITLLCFIRVSAEGTEAALLGEVFSALISAVLHPFRWSSAKQVWKEHGKKLLLRRNYRGGDKRRWREVGSSLMLEAY